MSSQAKEVSGVKDLLLKWRQVVSELDDAAIKDRALVASSAASLEDLRRDVGATTPAEQLQAIITTVSSTNATVQALATRFGSPGAEAGSISERIAAVNQTLQDNHAAIKSEMSELRRIEGDLLVNTSTYVGNEVHATVNEALRELPTKLAQEAGSWTAALKEQ